MLFSKQEIGLGKFSLGISKTLTKEFALAIAIFLLVKYIYLDPRDGEKVHEKLGPIAEGPYRVLLNDKRTFVIQRREVVERVNSDRVTYAPPPENAPPILRFETSTTHILEKISTVKLTQSISC